MRQQFAGRKKYQRGRGLSERMELTENAVDGGQDGQVRRVVGRNQEKLGVLKVKNERVI